MSTGNVLAVLVDRPWPAVTGARRRLQAMLAAIDEEDLDVFLAAAEAGPVDASFDVEDVLRRPSSSRAAARTLAGLPASRPPMMAFYRQPHVRRRLRAALASRRPSVVVTHHLGGAGLVDGLCDPARVVLDLPDFDVARFTRFAALSSGVPRLRWRAEASLTGRWLRTHLARIGAVTVTSAADAEAMRALAPAARIVVAPNGTTIAGPRRPDPGGRSLVFLGDLDYLPNREGVTWFADEVLPAVPDVDELRVVGRGLPIPGRRVTSLGFVEDLASEWGRATAMVVPLRAGGGTRLKILDAFGQGVPVVSTAMGVEGIDAEPDEHYLRAETPDEWRDALVKVLGDGALRERLAVAGRRLVEDRYTWATTMQPLVAAVRSVRSVPVT